MRRILASLILLALVLLSFACSGGEKTTTIGNANATGGVGSNAGMTGASGAPGMESANSGAGAGVGNSNVGIGSASINSNRGTGTTSTIRTDNQGVPTSGAGSTGPVTGANRNK